MRGDVVTANRSDCYRSINSLGARVRVQSRDHISTQNKEPRMRQQSTAFAALIAVGGG